MPLLHRKYAVSFSLNFNKIWRMIMKENDSLKWKSGYLI